MIASGGMACESDCRRHGDNSKNFDCAFHFKQALYHGKNCLICNAGTYNGTLTRIK